MLQECAAGAWEGFADMLDRMFASLRGRLSGIDPVSAEDLGFFPMAKGFPPDGARGEAGRHAYQALLESIASRARALYQPQYDFDPLIWIRKAEEIAADYGIPAGWLGSIVHHESHGKPWVYNWGEARESTAIGLGQTVYTSCRAVSTWHTFEPIANLHAAARILSAHKRARGSWDGALAGYAGVSGDYNGTLIARASEFSRFRG